MRRGGGGASHDFVTWNREQDLRIGPEILARDCTSNASIPPTLHVLPLGRIYCNVQFSILETNDKVTYTWIAPNGRRFHRKSLVKGLAQRRTWSWNFIDLSEERARALPGAWTVSVTLNGVGVLTAHFNLLRDWIRVERGVLPIILVCAHGGKVVPANCRNRTQQQGDDTGCHDTEQVTDNLASHLTYMFGVAPTLVACKVHRRWLDVDVEEEDAYTDAKMAPYYNAFYEAIFSGIQHTIKLHRRPPLILSVRAHLEFEQVIYASTLNGRTVAGMCSRNEIGDPRFADEGLHANLAKHYRIVPSNIHERDDTRYAAGRVVRTFGSDLFLWSADAIDLVFPANLCRGYGLRPLVWALAESAGLMYSTFVHAEYCDPPAPWALSNSNDSSDETIEELESIRGQQEEEHQSTGGQQEEELESTAGEQQEEEHMHTYIHIHEDQERTRSPRQHPPPQERDPAC